MRLLSSLFFSMVLSAGYAGADSKTDLIEKLNGIKSVTADFSQETKDQSGTTVNLSQGQLGVASGGKFNVQTQEPFEQHIISDGEDLYTYDVDLDQVVVQPLVKDPTQVPILLLGNANQEVLSQFDVQTLDAPDEDTLNQTFQLRTNDPGSVIEWINLGFNAGLPVAISLQDSLGQTTVIQLTNVTLNSELAADRFVFELPEGVDLIDDR